MSSGELGLDLLFDADDLDGLLAGGALVEEEGEEEQQELHLLSRRISGQYVDVVVSWAAAVFAGRPSEGARAQVSSALDALERLAAASGDHALSEVLGRLRSLQIEGEGRGRGARTRLLNGLREWVLDFARLLPAEDAQRVTGLVSFDRRALPLLDELAAIRGIGPKRLERLYAAGLFTVEVVSAAEPAEVAAVTGLPLDLARQVVDATLRFAAEQRRRVVSELGERVAELRDVLRVAAHPDPTVISTARAAIRDLQAVLESLEEPKKEVR
jgi:hypothetical protein